MLHAIYLSSILNISISRRLRSRVLRKAQITQLVESTIEASVVVGSNPALSKFSNQARIKILGF